MPMRPHRRGRPPTDKACHNCQRSRLRCDRSRPHCNKCASNNIQCLGYGPLYVWNDCNPNPRVPEKTGAGGISKKKADGTKERRKSTGNVAQADSHLSKEVTPKTIRRNTSAIVSSSNIATDISPETEQEEAGNESPESSIITPRAAALQQRTPNPGQYLDPLFQDFSSKAKVYLHHFHRVTRDIVAHDTLNANPFREILPIALQYPVLLNIVVASSAMHISNLHQPMMRNLPLHVDIGDHYIALRNNKEASRQAFLDALWAKQRAIHHMQEVVANIENGNRELAIMAAFFFVNIELIDFGRGGWRSHLQGGSKLLASLSLTGRAAEVLGVSQQIFDNVISNFVIYHILGSTLMSTARCVNVGSHIIDLLPVLRRTQADSYLCCPPFMLEIIPAASQLANKMGAVPNSEIIEEAIYLIEKARHYDLEQWVDSMPSVAMFHDGVSRQRVAASHRAAICLYVIRAVPMVRPASPVSVEELVQEIFDNMGQVTTEDVHFKGAAWPLFMAGAECEDEDRRRWIMDRLMEMWSIVPWGYILTAIDTLRKTWKFQEEIRNENMADGGQSNWLQDMWSRDFECLIV